MKSSFPRPLVHAFGIVVAIACLLAAGCQHRPAGGLLLNPAFERNADGAIASWAFNQHAGERSYLFEIDDETLTIERVGSQPWGQAVQTLPAAGLFGRTLEFSAEVSGRLGDESGAPITPTGLAVRISGLRPGIPAALGAAIFSTLPGEPAIGVGDHDWTVQRVVFEVPESATEIQLSLRLALDGTLRVRRPRLIELANAAP